MPNGGLIAAVIVRIIGLSKKWGSEWGTPLIPNRLSSFGSYRTAR